MEKKPSKLVSGNFMKRHILIIFILTSINLASQTKLTKGMFFPPKTELPKDYQAIVGDPKGWRLVGYFNLSNDKIEPETYPWDTLHKYTPYRQGKMYSKFKGNKIIGKGDMKVSTKIIYVTNDTLILEGAIVRKTKSPEKRVTARQLYKRVK